MAYMHKKTFDISQLGLSSGSSDEYFEIDDMIMLTVQTLNRFAEATARILYKQH